MHPGLRNEDIVVGPKDRLALGQVEPKVSGNGEAGLSNTMALHEFRVTDGQNRLGDGPALRRAIDNANLEGKLARFPARDQRRQHRPQPFAGVARADDNSH